MKSKLSDDTDPFGIFHYGLNASKEDHLLDLFENQLRRYSEECNNIQGFHLFLDSFNGKSIKKNSNL